MDTSNDSMQAYFRQPVEDGFALAFSSAGGGLILLRKSQQEVCLTPARIWLRGWNAEHDISIFFRPVCKAWKCPHCGVLHMRRVVVHAREGAITLAAAGMPISFVSLTSHERLGAAASLAVLPKAWNNLNRELKRTAGHVVEYFGCPEQHKDGRWHIHLIVAAKMGKRWWKDTARHYGMGYQADEREVISAGGVAGYVAKYQAKMLINENLPPYFRRVRHSNGWPKLPSPTLPDGWQFEKLSSPEQAFERAEGDISDGKTVYVGDSESMGDVIRMTLESSADYTQAL